MEEMLDENIVLKLNKNILKRHEPKIQGGLMFLYDVCTQEVWVGNSSTKLLIQAFDGQKKLAEIYNELKISFPDYTFEQIQKSFDAIILELMGNGFLQKQ
jgi:hypothetical protein